MELKELLEKENINIDIKELDKDKVYIFKVYFEDDSDVETIANVISSLGKMLTNRNLSNIILVPVCNMTLKDLKIFELDKE